MTSHPVPPIFFWEHSALIVFDSVAHAESWLEPTDMRDGQCVAFDAEGRRLRFTVRPAGRSQTGYMFTVEHVEVECVEESPSGQSELREILQLYLEQMCEDGADLGPASLQQLQHLARQRAPKIGPLR